MVALAHSLADKVWDFLNNLFKHFRKADVQPEIKPDVTPQVKLEASVAIEPEPHTPRK